MVWYEPANLEIITTAVEVDKTNRQSMSNIKDNIALSLPKTQARMLMKSRMQPTSYYPEYACFHHLRRHRFTCRQQELGQRDITTSCSAILCPQKISGGLPMVSRGIMNNHGHTKTPLSH